MFFVDWVQHAVGHGGFHTGRMFADDKVFSWVFDCGARRTHKFDKYLRTWTSHHHQPIDWLFISHFDTDHVSGLNELMSRTVVQDVMIPYVNDRELAYALLYEIDRGNLDRSFIELIADPASFFLSRGAGRVIFLGSGRSEGEPVEGSPLMDAPKDREDWKIRIYPRPRPLAQRGDIDTAAASSARIQIIDSTGCDIGIAR